MSYLIKLIIFGITAFSYQTSISQTLWQKVKKNAAPIIHSVDQSLKQTNHSSSAHSANTISKSTPSTVNAENPVPAAPATTPQKSIAASQTQQPQPNKIDSSETTPGVIHGKNDLNHHQGPAPGGWVTDNTDDFSIKYPENWTFNELITDSYQIPEFTTMLVLSPPSTNDSNVAVYLAVDTANFVFHQNAAGSNAELYFSMFFGEFMKRFSIIGDEDYYTYETLFKDIKTTKGFTDNLLNKNEWQFNHGKKNYVLGYHVAPASKFSTYKGVIDSILSSFKPKISGNPIAEVPLSNRKIIRSNDYIDPEGNYWPKDKIYDEKEVEIGPYVDSIRWQKNLRENLKTDFLNENGAPKGKYVVKVSLVLKYDGRRSNVKVLNNPGYGTAEEAVRFLLKDAHFHIADKNGSGVNCRITKAITFEVD